MNVNIADLATTPRSEILEMIKAKKLPTTDGEPLDFGSNEERIDFLKFANMDVDSQERTDFVSANSPDSGTDDPLAKADDVVVPDEDTDVDPDAEKGTDDGAGSPDVDGAALDDDPDKGDIPDEDGVDQDKESHTKLLEELARQQEINLNHRQTNGKQGLELKSQREQLETINQELQTLRKEAGTSSGAPVMPTLPDVSKFEEGLYSEDYQAAMTKYQADTVQWGVDMTNYKPEWATEIEASVSNNSKHISSSVENSTQKAIKGAWSDVWTEATAIQKKYGLTTSVPIETINSNQLIVNNPDSNTPDDVRAAQVYLNALTKEDLAARDKTLKAVIRVFDLSAGTPQRRFASVEAALLEGGIADEFKGVAKEVEPTEEERVKAAQKKHEDSANAASGMSSQDIGGADPLLNAAQSVSEKKVRLKELNDIRKQDVRAFKTSGYYEEYWKLREEFGAGIKKGA